jgi:transposase
MRSECTKVNFAGQDVYAGIDVGKRNWKVAICVGEVFHKRFAQEASPQRLMEYLERNFPGARYHCVYEAGFCGFWVHDELESRGAECTVAHPADVPTNDKERRFKNDHVDAGKLARHLRNKELTGIYVPGRSALEDRMLVRMRSGFVRKQTRCKNQIKGLLQFCGKQVPEEKWERHWSRAYIRWLQSIAMSRPSGGQALGALVEELLFLRQMILNLTRQIRQLAREEPYGSLVKDLCSVPGISVMTAMILATEIVDIGRFRKLEQLASYVGLVPGERSTGEREQHTGMTSRRNAQLRHMLIESAWVAQREDPALLYAFNELAHRMPKNEAIVRIAHKLLNRIRYIWIHRQPYALAIVRGA